MKTTAISLAALARLATAAVIWDGRFNDLATAEGLNDWSWANQVGPYQYYIHGSGPVTEYVELSSEFGNPADTSTTQGARISLTDTAYWNGQNMRRTELIPQVSDASSIVTGKLFYHFSLMRAEANAPATTREHQIAFFESHFVELKSGLNSGGAGEGDTSLRFVVGGQTLWQADVWEAGVWHNVAYEIDFSGSTVGLWHSVDGEDLVQEVAPVSASVSSNGADFHVGVLELPRDGYADEQEDYFWSGVYIEDGEITTSVAGPAGANKTRRAWRA